MVVLCVGLCCVCRCESHLNVTVTVREGLEKGEGKTEDITEKGEMRYRPWWLLGVWDAEHPNPVHKLEEKLLSVRMLLLHLLKEALALDFGSLSSFWCSEPGWVKLPKAKMLASLKQT